jgi:hypothetical protein
MVPSFYLLTGDPRGSEAYSVNNDGLRGFISSTLIKLNSSFSEDHLLLFKLDSKRGFSRKWE